MIFDSFPHAAESPGHAEPNVLPLFFKAATARHSRYKYICRSQILKSASQYLCVLNMIHYLKRNR